jgi:hypothetical protein
MDLPPIRPATLHKQNIFLRELLRTRNASLAAALAGVNRGSVYRWKLTDPAFAAAWAVVIATRGLLLSHRREKSHPATPVASSGTAASSRDINGFTPAFRSPQ